MENYYKIKVKPVHFINIELIDTVDLTVICSH